MAFKFEIRPRLGTWQDITPYIRLYEALDLTSKAEEGSVGMSTIEVDDPNGELDIQGFYQWRCTETLATGSNQLIDGGIISDREITRGPYETGTGRVWRVSLLDVNMLWGLRILSASSANRPAETDVARIQWLITQAAAGTVDVTTLISSSNPVAMDAVDYRGQTPSDVANDCAQQSGKNWFIYTDETQDKQGLWYNYDDAEVYTSPIRLSNELGDIDSTWTYAISPETVLRRTPERVYSGVRLEYDGGVAFERRQSTADAFLTRETTMYAGNVKTNAKATARAQRYLDDLDTEEDIIETSFLIEAAKVNFLQVGMRAQFKASHLPGYESFTWMRVVTRNVVQTSEEYYTVKVELSTSSGAESSPSSPGQQQTASSGIVVGVDATSVSATYDLPPGTDSLCVAVLHFRNDQLPSGLAISGWTLATSIESGDIDGGSTLDTASVAIFYRTTGTQAQTVTATWSGPNNDDYVLQIGEYPTTGMTLVDTDTTYTDSETSAPMPTLTPTAGKYSVMVVGRQQQPSLAGTTSSGWTAEETSYQSSGNRYRYMYYDQIVTSASGSYTGTVSGIGDGSTDYIFVGAAFSAP